MSESKNARSATELTLYTRPGCHLCDEMKAQLAPIAARHRITVREINIETDATLREKFNEEVPVLFLGENKIAKYFLDLAQLERQLRDSEES
jgi:glutaredoxin